MEKREEIKDGVKQRVIDFMAEQIIKEDSFIALKQELIEELFFKKEIKNIVKQELNEVLTPEQKEREKSWMESFGFTYNKANVENRLKTLAEERGIKFTPEGIAKETTKQAIENIKKGNLKNSLKGFTADFSNEPGLAEVYMKVNDKFNIGEYNKIDFTDYALKYKYTDTEKIEFRKKIVSFIKNNETKFSTETFNNAPNYYKKYTLTNVTVKPDTKDYMSFGSSKNDFKLNVSVIYNDISKSYYIDNFDCSMDSRYMMDKDLGLIFAVEVLEMMHKLEIADNTKFAENVFNSIEQPKDELSEVLRKSINEFDNKTEPVTMDIVKEAMRQTAKNIRAPKVVRDGIVKPNKNKKIIKTKLKPVKKAKKKSK